MTTGFWKPDKKQNIKKALFQNQPIFLYLIIVTTYNQLLPFSELNQFFQRSNKIILLFQMIENLSSKDMEQVKVRPSFSVVESCYISILTIL